MQKRDDIFQAANNGDMDVVTAFIDAGGDVNFAKKELTKKYFQFN